MSNATLRVTTLETGAEAQYNTYEQYDHYTDLQRGEFSGYIFPRVCRTCSKINKMVRPKVNLSSFQRVDTRNKTKQPWNFHMEESWKLCP